MWELHMTINGSHHYCYRFSAIYGKAYMALPTPIALVDYPPARIPADRVGEAVQDVVRHYSQYGKPHVEIRPV